MDMKALDSGTHEAIKVILSVINRQREHQGEKGFGRRSKWATLVSHGDRNIQIIPTHVKRRGINATIKEVEAAIDMLRATKSFDDYIEVRFKDGTFELFDRGKGVPSEIKFDCA